MAYTTYTMNLSFLLRLLYIDKCLYIHQGLCIQNPFQFFYFDITLIIMRILAGILHKYIVLPPKRQMKHHINK